MIKSGVKIQVNSIETFNILTQADRDGVLFQTHRLLGRLYFI